MDKITTELDLSPHVQRYWEEQGFCVHGEVSIYNYAQYVDHVAHTGPCSNPERVIFIEMKRGASKSLRSQLNRLDTIHAADELWGATISTPQVKTLDAWDSLAEKMWCRPGLLHWNGEGLVAVRWPATNIIRETHRRYHRRKVSSLLLIPENKGLTAGHPSGGQTYVTHWSAGLDYLLRWAQDRGRFTTQECFEQGLPPFLSSYKNPRSTMSGMLRFLCEGGHLNRCGKVGSSVAYEAADRS